MSSDPALASWEESVRPVVVKDAAHPSTRRLSEREATIRSLIEHPPKPNKHLKEAIKFAKNTVRD